MKTEVTRFTAKDDSNNEYTIEHHQPYIESELLGGGIQLTPDLGYYAWNGTKVSPLGNNTFQIMAINTQVKKV